MYQRGAIARKTESSPAQGLGETASLPRGEQEHGEPLTVSYPHHGVLPGRKSSDSNPEWSAVLSDDETVFLAGVGPSV